MTTLHVFQSECDWVVAENIDDAWSVWCKTTGETREDYDTEPDFWTQLDDDHVLRIWHEDVDPRLCGCAELRAKDLQEREGPRTEWLKLEKLIRSMGGKMDLPFPKEVETGRRFDPNGHEHNCPQGSDKKTCAQWAIDNGRGFLCSTEY